MQLYRRVQTVLLADIEALLRDTANARWTDAEIYRALSRALDQWHDRVLVPFTYTITNGWVAGTYEYALPGYINVRHMRPQAKRTVPYEYDGVLFDDDTDETWQDVPAWDVEADGSGGYTLRWTLPPWTTDGRILWWGENGHLPATSPKVSSAGGGIESTATRVRLTSNVDVAEAGYVLIDLEWIQYSGVTRGGNDGNVMALENLKRGLFGTTAADYLSADLGSNMPSVYFAAAATRANAFEQLYSQTMANLHAMFLTNAAPAERDHHVMMMRYYQQDADMFWRRWTPLKTGRQRLHRAGVGY